MKTVCDQPASCTGIVGCAELQRRRALNVQCISLRQSVGACYIVPHAGHQQQIAQRRNMIAKCDRKIALPEPQGCADPCP